MQIAVTKPTQAYESSRVLVTAHGYTVLVQPQLRQETKKVMHAESTRPPRDPDGTRPSTPTVAKTLGAVSATGALVARRWHLVRVTILDDNV